MNGLRNMCGAAFGVALAATAAWLIITPLQWDNAVRSYERDFAPPPGIAESSVGTRGRLFLENDSCYWIGYAREMASTGCRRIRHTLFDNTPTGRPVHWSQSISWLLVGLGHIRHAFTGEPIHAAIEPAAIWIGPLLQFILIAGTGFLLLQRMGATASLIWMLNLLTLPAIQWSFHPLRPDHHGLHLGFLLSSLLFLVLGGLGWVRTNPDTVTSPTQFTPLLPPGRHRARSLFAIAGILGGLGIWTGATVQLSGIAIVTGGAMLLTLLRPRDSACCEDPSFAFDPSVWRWWAGAGAVTSLVAYLIEYAPSFPGMRLEVNHPIYALSWLCAGELIARASAARTAARPSNRIVIPLLLLGTLLPPLFILLGPPEWHALRDPAMQRMHVFIDEFRPYFAAHRGAQVAALIGSLGVLPAFLVFAPLLPGKSGMRRLTPYELSALGMSFLAAFSYAVLTVWQVRWVNFFAAFALLLAVVSIAIFRRAGYLQGGSVRWPTALAVAMLIQPVCFFVLQFRDIHFRDISRERIGELIAPILQRQFAERLSALNTNGTYRIMGGPHMAARLHYYGGLPNVSSYYWENIEGLKAAAAFFAAEDDADALRIARQRGITHVVLPPSADFVRMFYYIHNGAFSEAGARGCLAGRLLTQSSAIPPWLKRDVAAERALQPGYLFGGEPVFGTLVVYTIETDASQPTP